MTVNITKIQPCFSSEVSFQRYSHDKYFNSVQKDIEPDPLPNGKILRAAQVNKMKKKLGEILGRK
jgi:hypothetical protein